jgi:cobalt-precorrin 5A hydrolase/precorrin-3B C17-methyltransferase
MDTGDNHFSMKAPGTIIFYLTDNGFNLARRLTGLFPEAEVKRFKTTELSTTWPVTKRFIFIMATGIVVRAIAPFIKNKTIDPAVVVLDEGGRFVISLLSGHIGGANDLAREIATHIGAEAVITTASDVQGRLSLDLWAAENDLFVEDGGKLRKVSARIVNGKRIRIKIEGAFAALKLPEEFIKVDSADEADVIITHRLLNTNALLLRPKSLILGIGCNRGTTAEEIEEAVRAVLQDKGLSFHAVRGIATIDLKRDEKGLLEFASNKGLKIEFFSKDELNSLSSSLGISGSDAVRSSTGAEAVAEPAAILAAGANRLLVSKHKIGNVTVAVTESKPRGRLYIVGIGPGSIDHLTPAAKAAIEDAEVIVGYRTYLDLIRGLLAGKEVISSQMRQEIDRCKKAVELAASGKKVAVISGGDPGIYAMAGLVFEILKAQNKEYKTQSTDRKREGLNSVFCTLGSDIDVEVIPGIAALNAAAAKLGAPLMHDFASISLSDLLTPWDIIEKRLEAAASADFVIILYNPKSKGRKEQIQKARDIILRFRPSCTPVGIVRAAMREDERIIITDLKNMFNQDIDMQSIVIIGNSQTFIWNKRMITPRGYEEKFKIKNSTLKS